MRFCICHRGKNNVFAKAQRSSVLLKQKKGRAHRSSPLTPGRHRSEGRQHRSVNFACVVLIALLISRQTKMRGSFIFSLLIFSTFIIFFFLHFNSTLPLPNLPRMDPEVQGWRAGWVGGPCRLEVQKDESETESITDAEHVRTQGRRESGCYLKVCRFFFVHIC